MNTHRGSPKDPSHLNLNLFRARMIAKLCIVVVCALQIVARLLVLSLGLALNSNYAIKMATSLLFLGAMIIVVAIEYILFKKWGPKIVKYSSLVDFMIFVLFLADWVVGLITEFQAVQHTNHPSLEISTLYIFTSFAWRTLLLALILQKWYLKVIPPVIAMALSTGYAVYFSTEELGFILIRGIAQSIIIAIILYCEDKLKWKMMWMNLQQEKWIQMNNFILNNIPENIMILDVQGQVKFVSNYCRGFMEDCKYENGRDFFNNIHQLHQLQNEPVPSLRRIDLQIERLTTRNEFMRHDPFADQLKIETLQDLVTSFRDISQAKDLQEREFLVYNGKLDIEEGEKSIEIKISFVHNLQDEYIILILRDTTQRDLLVALEETNRYKDQLLASVSHELRAPLNGNINLVESAVNSPKVSDQIKENLLIPALRSSKFLLHIINDILDMSQIKEKKLRLVFQSGDLIETIKSTVQLVELQAKKKGINLVMDLDPQLPHNFSTDHIRLSQIILNLINNAIKFTKEGDIVKLLASPMNDSSVQISVEDSGIGMTGENVEKLFSNYTHIEFEGRQKMNPTGVGLGLNIAYNLANLLAPEGYEGIQVKSILNQGSTFTFIVENKEIKGDIKNEEAEMSSISSCKIAEETPGIIDPKFFKVQRIDSSISMNSLKEGTLITTGLCSCAQVLVVDDNPFNTMAFETILSSLDINCDSVYSGSSAIKKLLKRENERCCQDCKSYSTVFIDQEMPEMTGSETVQEIRRLQAQKLISSTVRIIGCTAHQSKEEVEKFMKSGLDKCIHKPISPGIIKKILSGESSKS